MIGNSPRVPAGTSAEANFHRWVYAGLAGQSRVSDTAGKIVERTTRGTHVSDSWKPKVQGGRVSQYVLTDATGDDYFTCRTLAADGTCGENDVYIAKPYNLRKLHIHEQDEQQDVTVESWDGAAIVETTKSYDYSYKSATLRIKTDNTDLENPVDETQAIIPRFVPAIIDEGSTADDPDNPTHLVKNVGATVIYAIQCGSLDVVGPGGVKISKLALNDGWAWAKI